MATTSATAGRPGGPGRPDLSGFTAEARELDVNGLLRAYRGALALTQRPPPSVALPSGVPGAGVVTAVLTRLRPGWGAHRCAVRHVRRTCHALERGIAIRSSSGDGTPGDEAACEAVRRFREALPPPVSRLIVLGALIVGLILSHALVQWVLAAPESRQDLVGGGRLATALDDAARRPDLSAGGAIVRALFDANMAELLVFFAAVALSGYLLARPLACGYRLAAIALGRRDGRTGLRRRSALSRAAAELAIADRERAAFAAVSAEAPREVPFDLAVKALLWLPVLFGALFSVRYTLLDEDYYAGDAAVPAVLLLLSAARLLWLAQASRRAHGSSRWLAGTAAVLLAVALVAELPQGGDYTVPTLPKDQQLSMDLSARETLAGIDLRGRNLRSFYLPGKDLRGAQLSLAHLELAELSRARLTGAHLVRTGLGEARLRRADLRTADLSGAVLAQADLRDADLRGATLFQANLTGALVQGADLRDAELDGADIDGSMYDRRTRWPAGWHPQEAGAIEVPTGDWEVVIP